MDLQPISSAGRDSRLSTGNSADIPPSHSQGVSQAYSSGPHNKLCQEAPYSLAEPSSIHRGPIDSHTSPTSNGTQANLQRQSHQNQQLNPSSLPGPSQALSKYSYSSGTQDHVNSLRGPSGRQSGSEHARLAPHRRMLATPPHPLSEQTAPLEPLSTQPRSPPEPNIHPIAHASQSVSSLDEILHRRQFAQSQTYSFEQNLQSRHPLPQAELFPPTMSHPRPPPQDRKLYDPRTNTMTPNHRPRANYPATVFTGPTHAQVDYLERLAMSEISKAEMSIEELDEKEAFRLALQQICRGAITQHELERDTNFNAASVSLKCFGSLSTGFAIHSSDMDLALISPNSQPDTSSVESAIPRLLEKAFLDAGYGARLLTRTRVPIIKLCEKPTAKLRTALLAERSKWEEQRDNPPEVLPDHAQDNTSENELSNTSHDQSEKSPLELPTIIRSDRELVYLFKLAMGEGWYDANERKLLDNFIRAVERPQFVNEDTALDAARAAVQPLTEILKRYRPPPETHLDFPKEGVGIQCDINFSNYLALHNTRLLRCYSLCDPRVRLIVIFIKAWAKKRRINSPYHGTLSSYGYVLMVLHYLANIVEPPIIPNLQQCGRALRDESPENNTLVDGYSVRFWRSENEIRDRARRRLMTKNHEDSIGIIICGFFHYFAQQNTYSPGGGFCWSADVLSLRTRGGLLSKKEKEWTGAKSIVTEPVVPGQEPKEIRYRYLLAIEDPFELNHNIARTVVHNGIVNIRDEFRRAVAIIQSVGSGTVGVEDLLAEAKEKERSRRAFGPLPRKDNGSANPRSSPVPEGGVPIPKLKKGEDKSQAVPNTDQITTGINQLNINSRGAAERRQFTHTKNIRGNEPLHNQTAFGSSSHQSAPRSAANVSSSDFGVQSRSRGQAHMGK